MAHRILIVGEQPARSGGGAFEPQGNSTKRLAKVFDMDPYMMRNTFQFVNLMPWGRWDAEAARASAKGIIGGRYFWRYDALVLLGRRVAAAFGYGDRNFLYIFKEKVDGMSVRVVLCPHPSGVNRWWNSWNNREHARTIFGRLKRWAS